MPSSSGQIVSRVVCHPSKRMSSVCSGVPPHCRKQPDSGVGDFVSPGEEHLKILE